MAGGGGVPVVSYGEELVTHQGLMIMRRGSVGEREDAALREQERRGWVELAIQDPQ